MTQPDLAGDSTYLAPFRSAMGDVATGIQHAVSEFNGIVGTVNDWRWLLGPAMVWVRNSLDKVRDGLMKIVKAVNFAIEHETPVVSLILSSFAWLTEVKKPMSELSGEVEKHDDWNFGKWTGEASDAYAKISAEQQGAIGDTVGKAEFISQWLFKIAKSNVDYAVQLAQIVTSLVGKLVQAAADATTVVDLPWAIDQLSKSVGDLVRDGLNTLLTIAQRFVEALGDARDVTGQLADHSKMPHGQWPEAVRG